MMSDEKEVEYYAAKVNAWFNTKLERDKSLLVLSTGAIGLLVTLLTTVGVNSFELLFVFVASMVSFVICIVTVLAIFSRNAKYLEGLIAGERRNDSVLGFLDSLSIFTFILGVILASIIGLATAMNNVISKEITMSGKKELNQIIAPQGIEKRSFDGAQKLSPQQTTSTTQTSSSNPQSEQNQSTTDTGSKKQP